MAESLVPEDKLREFIFKTVYGNDLESLSIAVVSKQVGERFQLNEDQLKGLKKQIRGHIDDAIVEMDSNALAPKSDKKERSSDKDDAFERVPIIERDVSDDGSEEGEAKDSFMAEIYDESDGKEEADESRLKRVQKFESRLSKRAKHNYSYEEEEDERKPFEKVTTLVLDDSSSSEAPQEPVGPPNPASIRTTSLAERKQAIEFDLDDLMSNSE